MEKNKFSLNLQLFADDGGGDGGEPTPFDPTTLSPEALAWVDRQRTNASKTARKNAKEELLKDPEVLKDIERRANMTAEEKIKLQEDILIAKQREIALKENSFIVRDAISGLGLDHDAQSYITNLLVKEDADITGKETKLFVDTFDKLVNAKVDAIIKEKYKDNLPPKEGDAPKRKALKDMTYNEIIEFKAKDPEAYAREIKNIK